MRIVTWNVLVTNKKRQKGIEHILTLDPDVICLQEVSKKTLDWLTCLNGYTVNACYDWKNVRKEIRNTYVATLTKKKPLSVDSYVYDHDKPHSILGSFFYKKLLNNVEQHNVLVVTIPTHAGSVQIANTRLSCAVGTVDRLHEFETMVKKVKHQTTPTIYCGDFNVVDSSLFNRLTGWIRGFTKFDYRIDEREAFEEQYRRERLTNIFKGHSTTFLAKPLLQFDHILLPDHAKVTYKHVLKKRFGSDHKMLVADVEL